MSFVAKRIISFDNDTLSTPENLKRLADIFYKETGNEFDLMIFDDHIDDSNWNDGDGISGICDDEEFYQNISMKLGRYAFTVHIVDENDDVYEYKCCNGVAEKIDLGNLFGYFMSADEEAEDGECDCDITDFEPYHILYGGQEEIPATALNKNND